MREFNIFFRLLYGKNFFLFVTGVRILCNINILQPTIGGNVLKTIDCNATNGEKVRPLKTVGVTRLSNFYYFVGVSVCVCVLFPTNMFSFRLVPRLFHFEMCTLYI